jgi:hypothetical protein
LLLSQNQSLVVPRWESVKFTFFHHFIVDFNDFLTNFTAITKTVDKFHMIQTHRKRFFVGIESHRLFLCDLRMILVAFIFSMTNLIIFIIYNHLIATVILSKHNY